MIVGGANQAEWSFSEADRKVVCHAACTQLHGSVQLSAHAWQTSWDSVLAMRPKYSQCLFKTTLALA